MAMEPPGDEIAADRFKPAARLISIDSPRPLFGALAGTIGSCGDLIAPVDDEWDAQQ